VGTEAARATWLIFARTVARTLGRPRNLVLAFVFYAFPPALGWLLVTLAEPRAQAAAFTTFYGIVYPTLYLALPALLLGGSAIAREVEERTITYLLLRPVPRWTVVAGNYLAAVLVLGLLTTASLAAFYAICGLRGGPAKELGGTEAVVDSFEKEQAEYRREARALREREEALRHEQRARGRGAEANRPRPTDDVDRQLVEVRRDRRSLRRDRGDVGRLDERWRAGEDRPDRALVLVGILWLGIAANTALFLFLGTAIRHYFMAGIVYAVLYPLVAMPLFRASRIKWTVLHFHVQTLVHNEALAAPGRLADLYLGEASAGALLVLLATAVVFLAAACVLFPRKEYVLDR